MSIFNSNNNKPHPTEEGLISFAELIEKISLIFTGLVGLIGVINAFSAALTTWDVYEEIDIFGFLVAIVITAVYAAAVYFGCKLFSLLLKALAGIHENTRISAEIAKAQAEKENKE